MTIVYIDTETTGLGHFNRPPRKDAILSVGIAYRVNDSEIEVHEWLCNPQDPWFWDDPHTKQALAINNLTVEQIIKARPAPIIANQLHFALRHANATTLRAFNNGFDKPFLSVDPWRLYMGWGSCVMLEAHQRMSGGTGKYPKLVEALTYFGLEHPGPAHSAGADAHAALLLAEFMEAISD